MSYECASSPTRQRSQAELGARIAEEVTLNHTATQCFVGVGYALAYLNI